MFYTAHDRYVIDALRAKAFDFLLKPVEPAELQTVLSRLCKPEYIVHNYMPPVTADAGKPFVVTLLLVTYVFCILLKSVISVISLRGRFGK